jgi:hypothetical protein
VVEPSTRNPKVEGSNPATNTGREIMAKVNLEVEWTNIGYFCLGQLGKNLSRTNTLAFFQLRQRRRRKTVFKTSAPGDSGKCADGDVVDVRAADAELAQSWRVGRGEVVADEGVLELDLYRFDQFKVGQNS